MDPQTELFLAILAMDAYNRNPANGTLVASRFPGGNNIGSTQLGAANFVLGTVDNSTDFLATAWNWNGQYVVAYRGTVFSLIDFFKEAYNGYGVGAGSALGPQAQESIKFYQDVAALNASAPISNNNTKQSDDAQDKSSEPENQELAYSARIALDRTTMDVEGGTVNLSPGMAVTVEVKTGSRRIISYLLSPLLKFKQEALRER